jgi:ParB-like chromosome segregation protein Spo0J
MDRPNTFGNGGTLMQIRDRIVELVRVRAKELRPNPKNWRLHPAHQQEALRGLLAEIGYADALLARRLPDGALELIDGHLRAELTPDMEVPVLVLDLDDQESAKLLALLDPLAGLAEPNEEVLQQLLAEVHTQNQALQAVLDSMSGGSALVPEESEMPPDVPIPETFQVVVECRDEDDQRQLYERLSQEGYTCRLLTL